MTSYYNMDTSQYFYDSGYSDAASPASSSSSRAEYSSPGAEQTYESYLEYMSLPENNFSKQNYTLSKTPIIFRGNGPKPELEIIEQPADKFRFRYKSEMHGTHGSLLGRNSQKLKRSFPTVQLKNFHGRAVIRCTLYQTNELNRSPHSHKLVIRTSGGEDTSDPHDVHVSAEQEYIAKFQGMGIIHTAKKHVVDELISKKIKIRKFELGQELTTREESHIKLKSEQEAKEMNLNQVCLAFQAFKINDDNKTITEICKPIFSKPINNMKSALTGELKIVRLSAVVAPASGGSDLFLFVEKVGKKNIKVRFYEVDEFDEVVWEDWGTFSESDVHHQYAIALRTPQYKNKEINKSKDVYIQLVRPSDGVRSEPVPFKYKPIDYIVARKRAKMERENELLSSSELPQTILMGDEFERKNLTISEEYNKSKEIEAFLDTCKKDSNELIAMVNSDMIDLFDNGDLNDTEIDGACGKINNLKIKEESEIKEKNEFYSENNSFESYFNELKSLYDNNSNLFEVKQECLDILNKANKNNCDLILNGIIKERDELFLPLTIIRKLKLNGVLMYSNSKKQTCLHIACLLNKPKYIQLLIQMGADPNLPDYEGNTPLHIAIINDFEKCIVPLIAKATYLQNSKKLQVNCINYDGLTPLHLAIRNGNYSLVKKLIENLGASVKLTTLKEGDNPLHLACKKKNIEIVKFLLESTNVNINEKNLYGFTPLRIAIEEKAKLIIDLIKKFGGISDINESNNKNYSSTDSLNRSSIEENSSTYFDECMEFNSNKNSVKKDENSDESEESEESDLFDSICINHLSTMLNVNDKWKLLAEELNLSSYICLWMADDNPTEKLLCHINCFESNRISIHHIIKTLHKLQEPNAVDCVKEMLARYNCF